MHEASTASCVEPPPGGSEACPPAMFRSCGIDARAAAPVGVVAAASWVGDEKIGGGCADLHFLGSGDEGGASRQASRAAVLSGVGGAARRVGTDCLQVY